MTVDGFPVVGIVGAGQLARMTCQAAIALGVHVRVLAERRDDSAAQVCPDVALGSPDDAGALKAFAEGCDVVTLDHELVNLEALAEIEARGTPVRPNAAALRFAKDKLHQRTRFREAAFPVPDFTEVGSVEDIDRFAAAHEWPVVAKSQRGGYDGRGVWVLAGPADARAQLHAALEDGVPLLVEEWVPIEREIAVLVARRPAGEATVYPVVETVQRNGICHEVLAPAPLDPALTLAARDLGARIAELCGATGILATELFVSEGRLIINEVATRPHNSGHFSIDGCRTSQFENHLRAVLDLPLGPTEMVAPVVAMANVLAVDSAPIGGRLAAALEAGRGDVHPHLYGKTPRAGRKVGHVNALGDDLAETRARAARVAAILAGRAE